MLCLLETCLIVLTGLGLYVPIHPGYVAAIDAPAIVLTAHNTSSGALFLDLTYGSQVSYTDDLYAPHQQGGYTVTETIYLQALDPDDPYSDFIDMEDGRPLTTRQAWEYIYNRPGTLVLQTCVERDGLDTWGRFFVIAER